MKKIKKICHPSLSHIRKIFDCKRELEKPREGWEKGKEITFIHTHTKRERERKS